MLRVIEDGQLTAIADAIREKTGTSETMEVYEMPEKIRSMQGGDPLAAEIIQGTAVEIVNSDVETVAAHTLRGCKTLTTLNLPNAAYVGMYAFYDCSALKTMEMPKATEIGQYAFQGSGIERADFPLADTVGRYAFRNCAGLKYANFPLLTALNTYVLNGCTGLEEVYLPKVPTITVGMFKNNKNLHTIDLSSVTSIGASEFSACSALQNVIIPNAETIGNSAFSSCTSLKEADFPLVTSVGTSVFSWCTALEKLFLPKVESVVCSVIDGCSSLKELNLASITAIPDDFFVYQSSATMPALEKLDISSVTAIPEWAFSYKYQNLKEVVAPKVETTGDYAFEHCRKLEKLDFPLLTSVGEGSFCGLWALKEANIPLVTEYPDSLFGGSFAEGTEVRFPGVTAIGSYCFAGTGASVVELPDVTVMGTGVFSNAIMTKEIILPKVTSFDIASFSYCESLEVLDLSSATAIVDTYGFYDNNVTKLKELNLASLETGINEYTFFRCYNLEKLILSSVVEMPSYALQDLTGLKYLDISGVRRVDGHTFYECSFDKLILSSVTEIGSGAFEGFSGEIDFSGCTAVPTIASNAFYDHGVLTIKVPAALENEWKTAENWSSVADCIVGV